MKLNTGNMQPIQHVNKMLISQFILDKSDMYVLGVDRLSAPILSILPIIDIGHFKNRFADFFSFLCKQTYYLQVTLFIGE